MSFLAPLGLLLALLAIPLFALYFLKIRRKKIYEAFGQIFESLYQTPAK